MNPLNVIGGLFIMIGLGAVADLVRGWRASRRAYHAARRRGHIGRRQW